MTSRHLGIHLRLLSWQECYSWHRELPLGYIGYMYNSCIWRIKKKKDKSLSVQPLSDWDKKLNQDNEMLIAMCYSYAVTLHNDVSDESADAPGLWCSRHEVTMLHNGKCHFYLAQDLESSYCICICWHFVHRGYIIISVKLLPRSTCTPFLNVNTIFHLWCNKVIWRLVTRLTFISLSVSQHHILGGKVCVLNDKCDALRQMLYLSPGSSTCMALMSCEGHLTKYDWINPNPCVYVSGQMVLCNQLQASCVCGCLNRHFSEIVLSGSYGVLLRV